MTSQYSRAFDSGQRDLFERIASGAPLPVLLDAIVRFIERQADGILCSILLVDHERGCMHPIAAPSLPAPYTRALDGALIGPKAGSCGAAASFAERVIVEDIATHPYWENYRELVLPHGLRACWSSPIVAPEDPAQPRSLQRRVLGTFAMYYRERRRPTELEMSWVDVATHLAAIAIMRAATEQSLRDSEESLRAVIEHTPNVCIQLYDRAGRVLFTNRASRELFGWTELDTVGKTLDQLNVSHEETARFKRAIDEVAATGQARGPTEFDFVHPDGRPGTLLSTVFRIPSGDREDTYVCMDVNLTAYKRAQEEIAASERLQAFIHNHIMDVVFYLAIEPGGVYRFVSVNPAFCSATGLSERDVIGKTIEAVIPEPSCSIVRSKYAQAIATRRPVSWEETTPYPSGLRYGDVTVAPIFDEHGHCAHLVGTVHDVTERKAAEQERRELEAKFHHAQRIQALGLLAGGIAHDFNNLLTVIRSVTDVALSDATDAELQRDSLEQVDIASRRAAELVRQILDFSRKQAPKRQNVGLGDVVEEALRLLRVTMPRTIELHASCSPDTPLIYADATQLHQVVMNLVTNAAHATRDQLGRIEVLVDAAPLGSPPAPGARLRVIDGGCGMDDAMRARIFEPFFTTKGADHGTGLGLSVVQGIVKNHGGTIAIDSEPGRGTTFTLCFPAATA